MTKRIIVTILGLLLLIGALAGVKFLQIRKMIDQGAEFRPPPETVTSTEVINTDWETLLPAVGSLKAVQGMTVAAELPGRVTRIHFQSGAMVSEGTLLLEQDSSSERALLPGAKAASDLAKINLQRADKLLAEKVVSQAEYDNAVTKLRQAIAEADDIQATIAKKAIRAPFSGRLGIRQVDLGQQLQSGQDIVSLQTLDPIYLNFSLPQQTLSKLRTGLTVRVTSDAFPNKSVEGRLTTISPEVDSDTRNIRLQATLKNPDDILRPGMFVEAKVVLPAQKQVLVIPATAVLYAPYSDSVFLIEEADGKAGLVLRQQFVRLGEKRGDFVAVQSGLEPGQKLASSGVFKLRNGQQVIIDNTLAPKFDIAPTPENN
ncbi:efflux transporter periplasmic adaptor subunit [Syntrophotalea acetylenivorans]|uniref:Efflux transporter periplasmic adaptor subunit n=1 Tax=Syntrophotalea acetylenivorans TaxID=1842532 RepID=A0A1L3GSA5_9BACT|nr:efflux RND transporter periplasmic adaptor subunit [Syntrophotalea acetylenivorans]APG28834.1 efflux transporter periplasmic adaptor subunit [Syntrophotalea acetylenivorans]